MVAYKNLKTKKKSSWAIPKVVAVAYGSGRLRELFITNFKAEFIWGFAKVVVTRAGRLQEWSQGELRLYYQPIKSAKFLGYFEVPREMEKKFEIGELRNNRGSVRKIRNNE